MSNKKIFILLPDGIGLRNFAYSNFYKIGKSLGFQITYWNNTPFDLSELGFDEIKIEHSKSHPFTEIYKNTRKHIELNLSIHKTKDTVYNSYRFPFSYSTIKNKIKNSVTRLLIQTHNSDTGLQKIRRRIQLIERKTQFYSDSLITLKHEKPTIVFCTNQRPMSAIAPILAAQDLKIPTACFIFSWDNLPKATMVIETDYYFVWSEQMKKELLFYYPYIIDSQVFITGTPQFENYFDSDKLKTRKAFFEENQLDIDKKYVCYSGDDITTCPDDPKYLEHVAKAVEYLNSNGSNLGIVFRRCPVDFSNRYDEVIEKYKNTIVAINPKWEKKGDMWNTVLPTSKDLNLQLNTVAHTEMVINLGSSMVFDYVSYQKPCAFINYDVTDKIDANWSVEKIYRYVHFRSMPSSKAVVWLNSASEIANKIQMTLVNSSENIGAANNWFQKINQYPPENASERIWKAIIKILN